MLTEFVYQWNPFNICGDEVGIEDLIRNPLQPSETLRQDGQGRCRRIQVPTSHSTLWQRAVFWLQTHINDKGHLEAIDKIISLFYQKLLAAPPQKTENLRDFHAQIDQLRSLKNDYGFIHIKTADPSFIDSRLKEIEQHAYSIFTYYYKLEAIEQDGEKKKAFALFKEKVFLACEELADAHLLNMMHVHFLVIAPGFMLGKLFGERVDSIQERLQKIQTLHRQINEMEKSHEGQFTIPFIDKIFEHMRTKLSNEVCKIKMEAELIIRYLILNYRLAPINEEVKALLDSLHVDPNEDRKGKSCACLFKEALDQEIEKINLQFRMDIQEEE